MVLVKKNKNISENLLKISIKYRESEGEYNFRVEVGRKDKLKETDTKKNCEGELAEILGKFKKICLESTGVQNI